MVVMKTKSTNPVDSRVAYGPLDYSINREDGDKEKGGATPKSYNEFSIDLPAL